MTVHEKWFKSTRRVIFFFPFRPQAAKPSPRSRPSGPVSHPRLYPSPSLPSGTAAVAASFPPARSSSVSLARSPLSHAAAAFLFRRASRRKSATASARSAHPAAAPAPHGVLTTSRMRATRPGLLVMDDEHHQLPVVPIARTLAACL